MNRSEFMRQLTSGINTLPEEEFNNAINYYNEYFDEAGKKKEKKVIEELGNPSHIAEQIMADYAEKQSVVKQEKPKKEMPVWLLILLICTSPFWIVLAIMFMAVLLSLIITVFAFLISFYIISVVFVITGFTLFIFGCATLFQHVPTGIYALGASLVLIGLGLLMFIPTTAAITGFIKLVKSLFRKVLKK